MASLILSMILHIGVFSTAYCSASHVGLDFCIGFMVHGSVKSSLHLLALLETDSPANISVAIEDKNSVGGKPRAVVYVSQVGITDLAYSWDDYNCYVSSYEDRFKGICFTVIGTADGYGITIIVSDETSSHDMRQSYLALPSQELLRIDHYEYFVLSVSTVDSFSIPYKSGFLLVGLKNDTKITIYPSISLSIPNDTQKYNSPINEVLPGQSHTVILHRRQTLYIGKNGGADVTGTRIVSDKPLTVISGHEAGSVPSTKGSLEPMAQQIPPTQLWGKTFMIVPFHKFILGQLVKVLSSVNNTLIAYNCHQFSNSSVTKAGSVYEFFVPFNISCYIEANNSVLVAQFPYSPNGNEYGDSCMILVAAIEQYSRSLSFSTLNQLDIKPTYSADHSISIMVQGTRDNIYLNNTLLTKDKWTPIYGCGLDNETVVGYGTSMQVSEGKHTVSSTNQIDGLLFVMVYGFYTNFPRAFGHPAGFSFVNEYVIGIKFSSPTYTVLESAGKVTITYINHALWNETYQLKTISNAQYNDAYGNLMENITTSSSMPNGSFDVIIIDNDHLRVTDVFFYVELCYFQPHNTRCIRAKVTIEDDDDVVIAPYLTYNSPSNTLVAGSNITSGMLSPHFNTILTIYMKTTVMLLDKKKNVTFERNALFSPYQIYNEDQYYIKSIINESLNTIFVVMETSIVEPKIHSIKVIPSLIQNRLDKLKNTPSISVEESSSTTQAHKSTTESSSVTPTPRSSSTGATTPISNREPSSFLLNPSNNMVNFRDVFVYIIIGCIVSIMSLAACIVSGVTGIMCYRKGRKVAEHELPPRPKQQQRSRAPVIEHSTLELTMVNPLFDRDTTTPIKTTDDKNTTDDETVPPCQVETTLKRGVVLNRPVRSTRISVADDRYATGPISLEEHLYDKISVHHKKKKAKAMTQQELELENYKEECKSLSAPIDGFSMTTLHEEDNELTVVDDAAKMKECKKLTDSEQELANKLGTVEGVGESQF